MRRKFTSHLVPLVFFLPLLLAACNKYDIQPEQAEGFIKFFTSNSSEAGVDVKQTPDGGYVAIGNSEEDGNSDKDRCASHAILLFGIIDYSGSDSATENIFLSNDKQDCPP